MANTRPVYHYEVSPYRFAVSRRKSGRKFHWSALVSLGKIRLGLVVGVINMQPIRMNTRAELLSHLEYAYGKKPQPLCAMCKKSVTR